MHVIAIFEKVKNKLFAVCFESKDELDMALDFWRDLEQLREFFIHYREDLSLFDPALKVKTAVKQVSEEADEIYDRLVEFSENDKLDDLFKPLDNRELSQELYEFQKLKAKGERRKSMLRVYAVKFRDWYVITGAAIKLTDQMNNRPHLKLELNKLEITRKHLQEGSNPEGSFVYLDIQI
jgi:hypothetical protein